MTVTNAGERPGTEVIQLYLSDPVASVTRPVKQLFGYSRVHLKIAEACRVTFVVHTDLTSYSLDGSRRVVDPGLIRVAVGGSSEGALLRDELLLEGPRRELGPARVMRTRVRTASLDPRALTPDLGDTEAG